MSIAVSAIQMRVEADDIFTFSSLVRAAIFDRIQEINAKRIMSQAVQDFDRKFAQGDLGSEASFAAFFYDWKRENLDSLNLISPTLRFYRSNMSLMLCNDLPHFKDLLIEGMDFQKWVLRDFSFYNATDDQLQSGELDEPGWHERSKFWLEHGRKIDSEPLVSYSVLLPHESFPSVKTLQWVYDSSEISDPVRRREAVSKHAALVSAMKQHKNLFSPGDLDASRFFKLHQTFIDDGYPGWELVEGSLPKLLSVNFRQ